MIGKYGASKKRLYETLLQMVWTLQHGETFELTPLASTDVWGTCKATKPFLQQAGIVTSLVCSWSAVNGCLHHVAQT